MKTLLGGWGVRADIHWISPVLAGIPFALGNLSLLFSPVLYQIDAYRLLNVASFVAASGLLRYILGACIPLWSIEMFETLCVD